MTLVLIVQLVALATHIIHVQGGMITQSRSGPRDAINIRLPPALNITVDASPPVWDPMTPGWWHVAYSLNNKDQALYDLVWSLLPVLPTCGLAANSTPASCPLGTFPGQLNDLSTWFANSNSSAYVSAFGYDAPRRAHKISTGPGWVDV